MASPWDRNALLNYGSRRKAVALRKMHKRRAVRKMRHEGITAREARAGMYGLKAQHWYY